MFQRIASALIAALILAVPAPAKADVVETAEVNPWTLCAKATNQVEREQGIPRQLLRAISKAESGRYHEGKQIVMAWPWTVMAEGRGRYLETKELAIAEVEQLRARGVRNIDVGCMQVNLQHHPDAFASLDDAFDPLTNVTYAAGFLKTLAAEEGSWAKAAAYYHSQNPDRYRGYRVKVREIWMQEREKYLVALDQLRAEQAAALGLGNLIGVGAPLPVAIPQRAADDPLQALASLAFGRAGPVRQEISTHSQIAAR
ncbi:MAG TPA: transglycosylase SLT domain-containing protein [Candidatus Acidoferrum sp.]|nr:transglycosylase SLT domain-containing protein [Candidatus Acidoferrum sp.]